MGSDFIEEVNATSIKVFGGQNLVKEALVHHRNFIEALKRNQDRISSVENISIAHSGMMAFGSDVEIHYLPIVFDLDIGGTDYTVTGRSVYFCLTGSALSSTVAGLSPRRAYISSGNPPL